MTACVDTYQLPNRTSKRFSHPLGTAFSAPVSPVPSQDTSPRFASSSPRASFSLASASKSLPFLAIYADPPASVTSPVSPISPIEAQQDSAPPTPRRAVQEEGDHDSTTTPQKTPTARRSKHDLKRSLSMPTVAPETPDSPPFPSPSSSFHPPPEEEAEKIQELLDQRRPRISLDTQAKSTERRSSVDRNGPESGFPAADPPALLALSRGRRQSLRESEPMSAVSSSAVSSSGYSSTRPPSRPPSSYSEPVVPATPGLARRLSMSASRRGSETVVQQSRRVLVRDFAFSTSDPRFWGEGQPALPIACRTSSDVWAPSSHSSRAQLASWDEVENDVREELTSRGSTSTFSWGFITSHAEANVVDQMADSPADEESVDAEPTDLGPIPEGGALYLATYAFEPEADQEMRLDEGEIVRVYERICQGWVVAGRLKRSGSNEDVEEETGLVPENYLAPHKEYAF